ncbi:MAG: signal peptidase II [Sphingomonadales bacterium]
MRQGLAIAAAVLALDQAVKYWVLYVFGLPTRGSVEILPFFSLTMVWNEGVSLGLLEAGSDLGRWLLVGLTSAISVWIFLWLRRAPAGLTRLGLALVLGGAIGNIIDRVIYGAVADFVHLHAWNYDFYVFNVADSAITLGVIALIAEAVWGEAWQKTKAEQAGNEGNGGS